MRWDVEGTDEFGGWYDTLSEEEQDAIAAAVELLIEHGPGLGRPFVDSIKGSRHHNMKELRPTINDVRILFAFDPRRTAILLIGGSKRHRWQAWYDEMIPMADNLYDAYLEELRQEGLI